VRVVVPYFEGRLHPRVLPAITSQGYEPELLRCVNQVNHPDSYPHLLRWLFESGGEFLIIEHDVESRPGFIDALRDCPEPWCFFAYDFRLSFKDALGKWGEPDEHGKVDFAPLGHTRFRPELLDHLKGLLAHPLFYATWVARDSHIAQTLNDAGLKAHLHEGHAIHHHDYDRVETPAAGA
jgi:hypothetical protein